MKQLLALIGLALVAVAGLAVAGVHPALGGGGSDHRVTICHHVEGNGNTGNGFNIETVDKDAIVNKDGVYNGHGLHELDIIPAFPAGSDGGHEWGSFPGRGDASLIGENCGGTGTTTTTTDTTTSTGTTTTTTMTTTQPPPTTTTTSTEPPVTTTETTTTSPPVCRPGTHGTYPNCVGNEAPPPKHHQPKHKTPPPPKVTAPPPLCEKGYRLYHNRCHAVVQGSG